MPWSLNPSAYRGLPLARNPEFHLFALKPLAAGLCAAARWRRGARGRRLLAATWLFFYGLFLTLMLSTHSLVILGLRLFGRPAGAPCAYDFHLYALLLVGAAFISQGVRYLRAAPRLAARAGGRPEALRASLVVLGLAAPLIPPQFFGAVLSAGSLVSFAAVLSVPPAEATALTSERSRRTGDMAADTLVVSVR